MKGLHPGAAGGRRANEIFISYRRGDTDGQAHALRERFAREYGRHNVFMDVDSIVPGADFAQVIEDELASTNVMLVLIGSNWRGDRESRDRLSDPEDFVRLEVAAALHRNIPAIPVLIEAASLPKRDELPEPLRPLVRMQAVSLRSASWDYDISRVARAVAGYIKPRRRSRRLWPAVIIGAVIILAAVVALSWLPRSAGSATPRPGPSVVKRPPESAAPLMAAPAVAAVQPALLIEKLLDTPFALDDVPRGISPASPQLSSELTSLTDATGSNSASEAPGLMATVSVPFSSEGSTSIYYLTFDNVYDANSYFIRISPAPPDYTYSGPFSLAVIGDSTKCQLTTGPSQATSWGCLTLSANVVTYSSVIGTNVSNGGRTESMLAYDAVHHLKTAVIGRPEAAFLTPPGLLPDPADLYGHLRSRFPAKLIPAGLSHPKTTFPSFPNPPPGLEEDHYIDVAFSGSGPDYSISYINVEVFDNTKDAQSHYNSPTFVNAGGIKITQTYNVLAPSGFASSQQVRCSTYALSAGAGDAAAGVSTCDVQWGDVVILATTQQNATAADPRPAIADNDLAVILAMSGVLFVGQSLSA